jgi:hypothetical protein
MSGTLSAGRLRLARYSVPGEPAREVHAVVADLLARYAPGLYGRLIGQTGRGAAATEGAADVALCFRDCVNGYFERLKVESVDSPAYLAGKRLMEYGTGDLPGVAARMVARGAQRVCCVDRILLFKVSPKIARVLDGPIEGCRRAKRYCLVACLAKPDDPAAGFAPERLEYLVRPSGISGLQSLVSLVFSRAVLERVNDLEATFGGKVAAMRSGAAAIHQVDPRSHWLHKTNPLCFLGWSPAQWQLMPSEKYVANRWRIDKNRDIVEPLPVGLLAPEPTKRASPEHLTEVRQVLTDPFCTVSGQVLSRLRFWP